MNSTQAAPVAAAAAKAVNHPLKITVPTPGPGTVSQAAQTPAPIIPQTAIQMHAPWLTHTVAGIFILAAVGLIFLLAIQTTKQEGLGGTVGGRVESAYRGRLGADEQLKRLTGWVAGTFVFCAVVLSLTGI